MIFTDHDPSANTLQQHALDMGLESTSPERWRRDVAVIQTLKAWGELDEYVRASGWKMVPYWAQAPYEQRPAEISVTSPPQSRALHVLHPVLRAFWDVIDQRYPAAFIIETGRTVERQQWLFGQGRTLASALLEFADNGRIHTLIRQIPMGYWNPRARIVTRTLNSRHLIQPDGHAHAMDIGLTNGRKGMEQDARVYRAFAAEALKILTQVANNHHDYDGFVGSNGGDGDLMHWQIKPRG